MVTEIVVHIGDEHVGSSLALCPERVRLDDGGTYCASELQLFYLECWRRFWEDTAALKRRFGAKLTVISGGDERDGDHHNTVNLWAKQELDQDRAVLTILAEAKDIADEWHFIRGTPSHDGPASAATERYAEILHNAGWPVVKNGEQFSHWVYTGVHGGVKFDIAHAPGTKSWVPHTQGVACARHAQYAKTEYDDSGIPPPDLVIRHHVHYWEGPGCNKGVCCFFVPAWQAATPFVMGLGVKSAAPAAFVPGGLRIICNDGTWHPSWKLFRPPSRIAWITK